MARLSYLKALNRALGDEMARDPEVFVLGEDVGQAVTNVTTGLLERFGPQRVLETPISEQGFTNFATGAALAGRRPVVEYQIGCLMLLVFEQIANQANRFSLTSGGQFHVPVTYLLPSAGARPNWGAHHCDEPYSMFAHMGVKTVVPATPFDAYGLFASAIRDNDPVAVFAPINVLEMREDVVYPDLVPIPLGEARVCQPGGDVTVVAIGHHLHDALAVAEQLKDEVSVEVIDPRTLYPFDWESLAASLDKTGRLVVIDDSNRSCGIGAEIVATAAEEMRLVAPPKRLTRSDAAVLGLGPQLDPAFQASREQLATAVLQVAKTPRPRSGALVELGEPGRHRAARCEA
jgi:acetoin:2,6-dichlorophenolindophenol oxidoreductase subunit beta